MITPAQENERTLARILGIGEDQAAARLAQTFRVTAREGEPTHFAREMVAQLERTITHASDLDRCDLEIAVHAEPKGSARQHLYVQIDGDAVSIARQPHPKPVPPADLHGVQRMIAACYTASVALAALIDGIEDASNADPFVVRFAALGATRDVLSVPIRLDDTVLAGAGAIGNGFLRAARHLDISGALTIADPKVVGGGNPSRCLYFTDHDVGAPKAMTLATHAQPDFPKLTLTPFVGTFHKLVEKQTRVRRVIVGTDSRPVRRSIQSDLPLEVLDASTTGDCRGHRSLAPAA